MFAKKSHAELLASPMIKPVCGACNLVCKYCYYRQTGQHFDTTPGRMTDDVLREVVRTFCQSAHPCPHFSWQGGEPMLAGLEFFRKAVAYQQAFHRPGQEVVNMFQTNGTLLDDSWCRFLKRWGMLVGISIDGPPELHDRNRVYPNGTGSYEGVLKGLRLLQQYGVEHNVLVLVHNDNAHRAKEVYRFIRELGEDYLQFIPCVVTGLDHSRPGESAVEPQAYGQFLCEIFDEWLANDPRRSYDRTFNNMLLAAAGLEPEICIFREECAGCMLVEHNGDVFPCDFLVQPEWRLGNLKTDGLSRIFRHPKWLEFRSLKSRLPQACRECRHLDLCRGGCPRDRFGGRLPGGEPNYLCRGYRLFFDHARADLTRLAKQLIR
jgi:uncharacterized protein